jgi:hypothetical protein
MLPNWWGGPLVRTGPGDKPEAVSHKAVSGQCPSGRRYAQGGINLSNGPYRINGDHFPTSTRLGGASVTRHLRRRLAKLKHSECAYDFTIETPLGQVLLSLTMSLTTASDSAM